MKTRHTTLKSVGRWLLKAWMRLGVLLNRVCSPILLGVVYFAILTPIALLFRLFNHKEKMGDSSFVQRNKCFTPPDFEHPW